MEPHDYRIYYVNIISRRSSSARNVPSGKERGETVVFAGQRFNRLTHRLA